MHRPKKPITRKTIMMSSRMRELEMKEGRNSKSLLSNVLDMDDDFRWVYIEKTSMSVGKVVGKVIPISIVKTVKRKRRQAPFVMVIFGPGDGRTGTFYCSMGFVLLVLLNILQENNYLTYPHVKIM